MSWVSAQLDGADPIAGQQIGDLVNRLIETWPSEPYVSDKKARAKMLRLLAAVGDESLTIRFLRDIVLHKYDGRENENLVAAMDGIGTDAGGTFLAGFVKAHLAYRPVDTLALLRRIGETAGPTWDGALREGVRQALEEWPAVLKPPTESDRTMRQREERQRKPINHRAIHDLFGLALGFGLADEAKAAAVAVAEYPKVVRPDRIIPAALDRLRRQEELTGSAAYALLWRHAVASLLARSATVPEAPRDWRIASEIDCDCQHCAKLRAFCRNPAARTQRFPLRKDLRKHLHRIIDAHRLDMSHVTERRGRPYTLVCTKNRASYRRRLTDYGKDVSWMRSLIRSAPGGEWTEDCAAELERLREAVARSA